MLSVIERFFMDGYVSVGVFLFPDTTEASIQLEEKWKLLKCMEKMQKGIYISTSVGKQCVRNGTQRGWQKYFLSS